MASVTKDAKDGGDEHPSASSEPNGQLETEEGISSLALHGCTQVWSSVMACVKDPAGTAKICRLENTLHA